jgi:hypothetical protein
MTGAVWLDVDGTVPDAATVTAVVRARTGDPVERARLAEELHQLAGTAVGTAVLGGRRVLVMAGSRLDLELRHLHALDHAGRPVGVPTR